MMSLTLYLLAIVLLLLALVIGAIRVIASPSLGDRMLAVQLLGSIGVLRFPTVLCRLHALTKADNVGLGFIMLGLSLLSASALFSVKAMLLAGSPTLRYQEVLQYQRVI